MKLLSLVLASFAAAAVQAHITPWCHLPVRRSASAVAEAVAEAFPQSPWCHLPGQGCAKAKRAAEAAEEVKRSADAFAEAMAAFEKE
ncbi:hypothetical protein EMGR_002757 [Emarellia grisea]